MADIITASSNKRIRQVQALLLKGKARAKAGSFVAEGRHLFEEAPADRLAEVYAAASCAEEIAKAMENRGLVRGDRSEAAPEETGREKAAPPLYVVEDRLFDRISDTKTPQGVLCVVKIAEPDPEELISGSGSGYNQTNQSGEPKSRAPLFLLLDQIRDPGNLGTIIRAGEAAGVTGIWLTEGCADPYQPKVVRSAMGALYRMPVYICSAPKGREAGGPDRLTFAGVIDRWHEAGIRLYGSSLQASRAYDEPDYTRGTAFVIGNESRGIRPEVLARCDESIIIPMQGKVESLNAAIAASLMMFEAARQRRM